MPFYFSTIPTADVTTSGAANTAVDHLRALTVGRDAAITKLDLIGKGQGLATITGVEVRLSKFTTPSTVGSAIVPGKRNPDGPAATLTPFTGPTIGATENIAWSGGMMAAGQGGFVPLDAMDDAVTLPNAGGAAGNCDLLSQTEGTVALPFHYTLGHREL